MGLSRGDYGGRRVKTDRDLMGETRGEEDRACDGRTA